MNLGKLKYAILPMTILALLSSCSEENGSKKPTYVDETSGVFILNSGKKGQNNASISFYNPEVQHLTADVYMDANQRGLGDKAESMVLYGSKLYVTVYASNRLDVIDAATGKSLKQIQMQAPRCIDYAKGKLYVSLYGGKVCQLDTLSLEIEKTTEVGLNPQGIRVSGDKLYVAITKGIGGQKGETLDVVDLKTFKKTDEIKVVLNPQYIYTDSQGDLYVFSYGDYRNIKYVMTHIDGKTFKQTEVKDIKAGKMAIHGDKGYIMCNDYYATGDKNTIVVYDLKNEKILSQSFVTDGTTLGTLNGIAVDPVTGDVYVAQSNSRNNGDLSVFSHDGKLKSKMEVEVYPSDVVFRVGKKLVE